MLKTLAVLAAMTSLAAPAAAQALTIPSPEDAKGAVIRMMNDPAMAKLMVNGHVKLGTCKKTTKAAHDGEVACTLAVVMGAGSSETQANFYRLNGRWVAEPTEEDLPFPDPKVR
jgi:hypothetical protein